MSQHEPPPSSRPKRAALVPVPTPPKRSLRVLVVDDEPIVADMLQQMLALAGHHADVASGAQEALKVYKPGAFDLVVTDYSMPGLKGDALAASIRKQAPEQRIVMLTGFDEGVASCGPAGVDLVVSKPLILNEFLPAIARLFETQRPAAVA